MNSFRTGRMFISPGLRLNLTELTQHTSRATTFGFPTSQSSTRKWSLPSYRNTLSVNNYFWKVIIFREFDRGNFARDQNGLPSTDCHLQSDGKVQCAAARVYTTHCPTDFTNWPYDAHNCTLHFGSWIHYGSKVNLTFGDVSTWPII